MTQSATRQFQAACSIISNLAGQEPAISLLSKLLKNKISKFRYNV
nr:MAG TPA: hypothetical protein [Caudoviricetes sp.]